MTKQLEKSQEQKKENKKDVISFCKENVGRRFIVRDGHDLRELQLLEISSNGGYVKVEWRDMLSTKWYSIHLFNDPVSCRYTFIDILEDLRSIINVPGPSTVTIPLTTVQLKETEKKTVNV